MSKMRERYYLATVRGITVLRASRIGEYTHAVIFVWEKPRLFVRNSFTDGEAEAEALRAATYVNECTWSAIAECREIGNAEYRQRRSRCQGQGVNSWIRERTTRRRPLAAD